MLKPRKLLLLLASVATFGFSHAQNFGGNPSSWRWNYLSINRAKVIYPAGNLGSAARIGQLIEKINAVKDSSIGQNRWPVDIILQPATTIPNGYVALAPFRSEFQMTPPSNPFELGALPWTEQLALHEYRHVEQYSNFNKGGAKLFRIVLGQQGQALANALTIPDWFFEGDAVFQESLFSRQGRGRLPSFFNGYRSLWEAGARYSYAKLRNGSLKHFVPDHYELGYQLVAFGREKYGPAFWRAVSEDAAAMKGVFYPWQKSIRKHTGMAYQNFIELALAASKQKRSDSLRSESLPVQEVRNEENPVFTEKGGLLFIGGSYKNLSAFYLQTPEGIRKIRTMDRVLDHYFSYAGNKIVYASFRPHHSRAWVDYSELQILNIQTGRQDRITRKSKYFSPSLSAGADSIVAVHIAENGTQQIQILDTSGSLLKAIPNERQFSFSHPVFWKGKILTAAKNASGEMTLLLIDLKAESYKPLLRWSFHVMGFPSGSHDTIYFSIAYNGRDELAALNTINGELCLLKAVNENSHTGNYRPSVYKEELTFTKFSAAGYKIARTDLRSVQKQPIPNLGAGNEDAWISAALPSSLNSLADPSDTTVYNEQQYPKHTRLFNFHSWQPYYEDPEYSLTLYGQNVLNSFQSQSYFVYNQNEDSKKIGFTGAFGGWFPFFHGSINYTFGRSGLYQQQTIRWNQLEAAAGFSAPLDFSRGRYIRFLRAGSELVLNQDYFHNADKPELKNRSYWYLNHSLGFSNRSLMARQQFNPRWAQSLTIHGRHSLQQPSSWQFLASANLYFPGIFSNHSVYANFALQQHDTLRRISFSDEMPFARGYGTLNFAKGYKWSLNYQLPLLYPDRGAWNIFYLLRIRAGFYYDQAFAMDRRLFGNKDTKQFRSMGSELYFDTKWWNQLPVTIGIRYARLLDEDLYGGSGSNRWEIILPYNLIPGKPITTKSLAF